MVSHLLVRVVDPERPDGGIVTHIDGLPWAFSKYSHKEGYEDRNMALRLPILGPVGSDRWLNPDKRTVAEREAVWKILEDLRENWVLPQNLPFVLKILSKDGWQIATESVVTTMGATETWATLVNKEFSFHQRTDSPRSYKTITMISKY